MRPQSESAKTLLLLLRQDPIPIELEITVLPIDEVQAEEGGQVSSEINATDDFLKVDIHLGIGAHNLPGLARDFRKDYYALRPSFICNRNKLKFRLQDDVTLNQRLNDSTTCLLMLCPDHATAWSDRRHSLLLSNSWNIENNDLKEHPQSLWKGEIRFLDMLFSQHSKAPNAWSHRKWICHQIVINIQNSPLNKTQVGALSQTWQLLISWARHEIKQCVKVAGRFPKNYYAWTHRSFIIRTLVDLWTTDTTRVHHPHNNDNVSMDPVLKLLQEEVKSINPWLRQHVSDHSAAHYGGEVLRILLQFADLELKSNINDLRWKINIIQEQLDESRRLALFFRSHEVIWIWRRICSQIFLGTLAELSSHSTASDSKTILTQAIHQFVDIDVNQTHENCLSKMPSLIDDEYQRCVLHSNTYIMWILESFKRYNSHNLIVNEYNLRELESKVAYSLSKNDKICHNMWRNI